MYHVPAHKNVDHPAGQFVPAKQSAHELIAFDVARSVGLLALRKAKRWLGRSLESYSPDFRSASSNVARDNHVYGCI